MREALEHFEAALAAAPQKHGELISLAEAGWVEQFPDERYWSFTHPQFPGGEVRWSPRGKARWWGFCDRCKEFEPCDSCGAPTCKHNFGSCRRSCELCERCCETRGHQEKVEL